MEMRPCNRIRGKVFARFFLLCHSRSFGMTTKRRIEKKIIQNLFCTKNSVTIALSFSLTHPLKLLLFESLYQGPRFEIHIYAYVHVFAHVWLVCSHCLPFFLFIRSQKGNSLCKLRWSEDDMDESMEQRKKIWRSIKFTIPIRRARDIRHRTM